MLERQHLIVRRRASQKLTFRTTLPVSTPEKRKHSAGSKHSHNTKHLLYCYRKKGEWKKRVGDEHWRKPIRKTILKGFKDDSQRKVKHGGATSMKCPQFDRKHKDTNVTKDGTSSHCREKEICIAEKILHTHKLQQESVNESSKGKDVEYSVDSSNVINDDCPRLSDMSFSDADSPSHEIEVNVQQICKTDNEESQKKHGGATSMKCPQFDRKHEDTNVTEDGTSSHCRKEICVAEKVLHTHKLEHETVNDMSKGKDVGYAIASSNAINDDCPILSDMSFSDADSTSPEIEVNVQQICKTDNEESQKKHGGATPMKCPQFDRKHEDTNVTEDGTSSHCKKEACVAEKLLQTHQLQQESVNDMSKGKDVEYSVDSSNVINDDCPILSDMSFSDADSTSHEIEVNVQQICKTENEESQRKHDGATSMKCPQFDKKHEDTNVTEDGTSPHCRKEICVAEKVLQTHKLEHETANDMSKGKDVEYAVALSNAINDDCPRLSDMSFSDADSQSPEIKVNVQQICKTDNEESQKKHDGATSMKCPQFDRKHEDTNVTEDGTSSHCREKEICIAEKVLHTHKLEQGSVNDMSNGKDVEYSEASSNVINDDCTRLSDMSFSDADSQSPEIEVNVHYQEKCFKDDSQKKVKHGGATSMKYPQFVRKHEDTNLKEDSTSPHCKKEEIYVAEKLLHTHKLQHESVLDMSKGKDVGYSVDSSNAMNDDCPRLSDMSCSDADSASHDIEVNMDYKELVKLKKCDDGTCSRDDKIAGEEKPVSSAMEAVDCGNNDVKGSQMITYEQDCQVSASVAKQTKARSELLYEDQRKENLTSDTNELLLSLDAGDDGTDYDSPSSRINGENLPPHTSQNVSQVDCLEVQQICETDNEETRPTFSDVGEVTMNIKSNNQQGTPSLNSQGTSLAQQPRCEEVNDQTVSIARELHLEENRQTTVFADKSHHETLETHHSDGDTGNLDVSNCSDDTSSLHNSFLLPSDPHATYLDFFDGAPVDIPTPNQNLVHDSTNVDSCATSPIPSPLPLPDTHKETPVCQTNGNVKLLSMLFGTALKSPVGIAFKCSTSQSHSVSSNVKHSEFDGNLKKQVLEDKFFQTQKCLNDTFNVPERHCKETKTIIYDDDDLEGDEDPMLPCSLGNNEILDHSFDTPITIVESELQSKTYQYDHCKPDAEYSIKWQPRDLKVGLNLFKEAEKSQEQYFSHKATINRDKLGKEDLPIMSSTASLHMHYPYHGVDKDTRTNIDDKNVPQNECVGAEDGTNRVDDDSTISTPEIMRMLDEQLEGYQDSCPEKNIINEETSLKEKEEFKTADIFQVQTAIISNEPSSYLQPRCNPGIIVSDIGKMLKSIPMDVQELECSEFDGNLKKQVLEDKCFQMQKCLKDKFNISERHSFKETKITIISDDDLNAVTVDGICENTQVNPYVCTKTDSLSNDSLHLTENNHDSKDQCPEKDLCIYEKMSLKEKELETNGICQVQTVGLSNEPSPSLKSSCNSGIIVSDVGRVLKSFPLDVQEFPSQERRSKTKMNSPGRLSLLPSNLEDLKELKSLVDDLRTETMKKLKIHSEKVAKGLKKLKGLKVTKNSFDNSTNQEKWKLTWRVKGAKERRRKIKPKKARRVSKTRNLNEVQQTLLRLNDLASKCSQLSIDDTNGGTTAASSSHLGNTRMKSKLDILSTCHSPFRGPGKQRGSVSPRILPFKKDFTASLLHNNIFGSFSTVQSPSRLKLIKAANETYKVSKKSSMAGFLRSATLVYSALCPPQDVFHANKGNGEQVDEKHDNYCPKSVTDVKQSQNRCDGQSFMQQAFPPGFKQIYQVDMGSVCKGRGSPQPFNQLLLPLMLGRQTRHLSSFQDTKSPQSSAVKHVSTQHVTNNASNLLSGSHSSLPIHLPCPQPYFTPRIRVPFLPQPNLQFPLLQWQPSLPFVRRMFTSIDKMTPRQSAIYGQSQRNMKGDVTHVTKVPVVISGAHDLHTSKQGHISESDISITPKLSARNLHDAPENQKSEMPKMLSQNVQSGQEYDRSTIEKVLVHSLRPVAGDVNGSEEGIVPLVCAQEGVVKMVSSQVAHENVRQITANSSDDTSRIDEILTEETTQTKHMSTATITSVGARDKLNVPTEPTTWHMGIIPTKGNNSVAANKKATLSAKRCSHTHAGGITKGLKKCCSVCKDVITPLHVHSVKHGHAVSTMSSQEGENQSQSYDIGKGELSSCGSFQMEAALGTILVTKKKKATDRVDKAGLSKDCSTLVDQRTVSLDVNTNKHVDISSHSSLSTKDSLFTNYTKFSTKNVVHADESCGNTPHKEKTDVSSSLGKDASCERAGLQAEIVSNLNSSIEAYCTPTEDKYVQGDIREHALNCTETVVKETNKSKSESAVTSHDDALTATVMDGPSLLGDACQTKVTCLPTPNEACMTKCADNIATRSNDTKVIDDKDNGDQEQEVISMIDDDILSLGDDDSMDEFLSFENSLDSFKSEEDKVDTHTGINSLETLNDIAPSRIVEIKSIDQTFYEPPRKVIVRDLTDGDLLKPKATVASSKDRKMFVKVESGERMEEKMLPFQGYDCGHLSRDSPPYSTGSSKSKLLSKSTESKTESPSKKKPKKKKRKVLISKIDVDKSTTTERKFADSKSISSKLLPTKGQHKLKVHHGTNEKSGGVEGICVTKTRRVVSIVSVTKNDRGSQRRKAISPETPRYIHQPQKRKIGLSSPLAVKEMKLPFIPTMNLKGFQIPKLTSKGNEVTKRKTTVAGSSQIASIDPKLKTVKINLKNAVVELHRLKMELKSKKKVCKDATNTPLKKERQNYASLDKIGQNTQVNKTECLKKFMVLHDKSNICTVKPREISTSHCSTPTKTNCWTVVDEVGPSPIIVNPIQYYDQKGAVLDNQSKKCVKFQKEGFKEIPPNALTTGAESNLTSEKISLQEQRTEKQTDASATGVGARKLCENGGDQSDTNGSVVNVTDAQSKAKVIDIVVSKERSEIVVIKDQPKKECVAGETSTNLPPSVSGRQGIKKDQGETRVSEAIRKTEVKRNDNKPVRIGTSSEDKRKVQEQPTSSSGKSRTSAARNNRRFHPYILSKIDTPRLVHCQNLRVPHMNDLMRNHTFLSPRLRPNQPPKNIFLNPNTAEGRFKFMGDLKHQATLLKNAEEFEPKATPGKVTNAKKSRAKNLDINILKLAAATDDIQQLLELDDMVYTLHSQEVPSRPLHVPHPVRYHPYY